MTAWVDMLLWPALGFVAGYSLARVMNYYEGRKP